MNNQYSVYMRKEQEKKETELKNFRTKANNIIIPFFAGGILFFCFVIFKVLTV